MFAVFATSKKSIFEKVVIN